MTFSFSTLARSLADYLAPDLPDATFYEDPNQQNTRCPCVFLQQRFARAAPYPGGRWLRRIGVELVYLEGYTLADVQRRYRAAAEKLDQLLGTFPYTDPQGQTALLRALERRWDIDLEGLHYSFELKIWSARPCDGPPMQSIQQFEEELR